MWQLLVTLALVFCGTSFAFGQTASGDAWKIMTWPSNTKNAPEWEQKLRISAVRAGCKVEPTQCMKYASNVSQEGKRKVFLAIFLKPESPTEAQEYSGLTLQSPFIQEVGIDDFLRQYNDMSKSSQAEAIRLIGTTIDNLKSKNPNIKFGVTMYANELSSPMLKEDKLPARIRSKVDYVHMYLRYREHAQNYESFVQQSKSVFPNARIIAGAYAYDRINYVPCAPENKRNCTKDEELKLFMQALATQVRLLKSGSVEWIEFYPGAYGLEEGWTGWDNGRICDPKRKSACVENSKEMWQAAAALLNKEMGPR